MAGVASGTAALIPGLWVAWSGGSLAQLADRLGVSALEIALIYSALLIVAGAVYGRVFMRAANDRRTSWLFGISYGFVTWMAGPVTAAQWITGGPGVVGIPAQLLFAAHLCYGLTLGVLYPFINAIVQRGHLLDGEERHNIRSPA